MYRMFCTMLPLIVAVWALMAVPAAHAAEESDPWSGKAAFGLLAASGNSDTTNVSAAVDVEYDLKRWHHAAGLVAAGAESNGMATAERYQAGYKAKYDFSEHDYLFGLINFEKDKFSGYDSQVSEALGYGRRLLNTSVHRLNVEIGAGFKQSTLRDGTSEDGAILRAGTDYRWKFSDTASFNQLLAVESSGDNTYVESVSQIKARLLESLALALTYTVKNNSDVPIGSEKTDTFTAVSLEYGF